MRSRNWSIRSKIIVLVAVPLVSVLCLWGFLTVLTIGPAINLLSAQTVLNTVATPGQTLMTEVQRERRLSVEFLSAAPSSSNAALITQRAATDRAAADFRRTATSDDARDAVSETLEARIAQNLSELDGLPANRLHIDRREIDPVGAQNLFNGIVDTGFQMFSAAAAFGDDHVDREIRALTTVGRGQEYLNRADSLLAGAFAAGKITDESRTELVQAIGTSRFLFTQGVTDLPARDRTGYQRLSSGEAPTRLRELQDDLISKSRAGAAAPVTAAAWQPAFDSTDQQLRAFQLNASDTLTEEATPVATTILIRLALSALNGLIALVLSIWIAIRVGRSIVGRLSRLRGEALEMASERLPTVVRRLQRGEAVDVDVETPPLAYGHDEIGQLGQAFNEVQRTAVQSAVEEANVRRGINEVFLNIARRSQTLLHRQLALLDRMERRETEPQELEDLYRVDHLATRMRRHAEDLVILAGAAPGRGWRNPVPLIDVVRGAISEVEDYKRVDILSIESSAVLGRAVGDVIHLVAELLENAASFSPPHTRVQVVGQVLPNGYALEIEDRGLGMSADAINDANRKLMEPPDFDPSDSARLGLFVVAQLANRHGIRVSLRPSAYGGVTAIVLVPGELITGPPGRPGLPELPAGPSAPDKSWDRPLVGTGTEDPARSSLGSLQWPGTEELRSISVTKRPVTINGTATADPGPGDPFGGTPAAPPAGLGGPTPSAVVDGLTADGLVQRRRTRKPRSSDRPDAPPALLPPNQTSPTGLNTGDFPAVGNGLTTNGAASGGAGSGGAGSDTNGVPYSGLNGNGFGGSGFDASGFDGGGFSENGPLGGRGPDQPLRHGDGPAVLPVSGAPTIRPPRIPAQRTSPETISPLSPLSPAAPTGPIEQPAADPAEAAPTGSAPTGSAPTGTAATGSAPTGTAATGSAPIDAMPTNTAPTNTAPTDAMPTETVPTDAMPIDPVRIDTASIDTVPIDTGSPERALADTGLADTGLADTGLAGTGLAGTGLAGTGLAGTGLAGTGSPESGLTQGASPETALTDTGRRERDTGLRETGSLGAELLRTEPFGSTPLRAGPFGTGPLGTGAGGDDSDADEALLPRRVRQASLAPQLRAPVTERAAASRSPEQVRSLMSALQQGTTRGRREAAGLSTGPAGKAADGPVSDKQQTVGEPTWSEAATVTFPAIQAPVAAGADDKTDNAPDENHENRPEKDA